MPPIKLTGKSSEYLKISWQNHGISQSKKSGNPERAKIDGKFIEFFGDELF